MILWRKTKILYSSVCYALWEKNKNHLVQLESRFQLVNCSLNAKASPACVLQTRHITRPTSTHYMEKTASAFFVFHLVSTASSLVAKNRVLTQSLWPMSASYFGVSCLVISSSLHIYQLPSHQWERDTDRMIAEWFVVLLWNHGMTWHTALCINWYSVLCSILKNTSTNRE